MEMENLVEKGWLEGISKIKDDIVDFKIHLRKVYEDVYSGLSQNHELSTNMVYALSKLSYQDSRLDDMDMEIKELLGKVDRIVEDVQKMVNMKQCSHFQETIANGAQPMEELSISNHFPAI